MSCLTSFTTQRLAEHERLAHQQGLMWVIHHITFSQPFTHYNLTVVLQLTIVCKCVRGVCGFIISLLQASSPRQGVCVYLYTSITQNKTHLYSFPLSKAQVVLQEALKQSTRDPAFKPGLARSSLLLLLVSVSSSFS